jgi:hypothetical protein
MKRSVVVLALFPGLAASPLAQVQGETIAGTVQDEQGALLPGVSEILTQTTPPSYLVLEYSRVLTD